MFIAKREARFISDPGLFVEATKFGELGFEELNGLTCMCIAGVVDLDGDPVVCALHLLQALLILVGSRPSEESSWLVELLFLL